MLEACKNKYPERNMRPACIVMCFCLHLGIVLRHVYKDIINGCNISTAELFLICSVF